MDEKFEKLASGHYMKKVWINDRKGEGLYEVQKNEEYGRWDCRFNGLLFDVASTKIEAMKLCNG